MLSINGVTMPFKTLSPKDINQPFTSAANSFIDRQCSELVTTRSKSFVPLCSLNTLMLVNCKFWSCVAPKTFLTCISLLYYTWALAFVMRRDCSAAPQKCCPSWAVGSLPSSQLLTPPVRMRSTVQGQRLLVTVGRGMLALSGKRPGMLLNILQGPGQPQAAENLLPVWRIWNPGLESTVQCPYVQLPAFFITSFNYYPLCESWSWSLHSHSQARHFRPLVLLFVW